MAFDAGSIEASLTLDRSPFTRELDLARSEGANFAGQTFTANLGADAAGFNSVAGAVRSEAAGIGSLRPTVVIGANNAASGVFSAVRSEAAGIGSLRPTVVVGANNAASSVFSAVRAEAGGLSALRPTITVTGNNQTGAAFGAARSEAAALSSTSPTITVSGNASPWLDTARASGAAALALSNLRPTITVDGANNFTPTADAVTAEATALGSLNPTVTITGENNFHTAAEAVTTEATAVGRLRPNVRVTADTAGATAQIVAFTGVTTGATTASGVLTTALGGLSARGAIVAAAIVAVIAVAGPLVAILTVAGSVAASLAAGIGLLALGFGPLIKNIMDGSKANEDYTKAQEGVTKATDDVAKKQQAQQDALDKLNKLKQQGSQGNVTYAATSQQVASADQARNNATAALQKSTIAQQQAQQRYNAAVAEYGENSEQARSASASLQTANISLSQAQEKVRTTTERYNQVEAQSRTVKSTGAASTNQLEAAQKAYDKATEDVAGAVQKQDQAQGKLSGTMNQQQGATKTLFDQWENLKRTYEENFLKNEQLGNSMVQLGTKVLDLANRAIPSLATVTQRTVDQVSTAFTTVGNEVGTGPFKTFIDSVPGIMGSMTTAVLRFGAGFLNIINQANPLAQQFAGWLARIASDFLSWTQSEAGRAQIQQFLQSAVPFAQALWDALTKIVPPLFQIGVTYGPTVARVVGDISTQIGNVLSWIRDNKPLFDSLVQFFKDIASAAEGSGTSLETARKSLEAFDRQLTDSIQPVKDLAGWMDWLAGQGDEAGNTFYTDVRKWFADLYTELVSGSIVPDMVNDIVGWLGGLPGKAASALGSLITDITKPFTDTWDSVSETLQGWMEPLATFGKNMITSIVNGINSMAGSLSGAVGTLVGNAINSARSALGGGSTTGHTNRHAAAFGGVVSAAAGGVVPGYVTGPSMMAVGGTQVLYGEALSASNREYAFDDPGGGVRFITEEPGFNGASQELWADLGVRQGWLGGAGGGGVGGASTAGLEKRLAHLETVLDRQTKVLVGALREGVKIDEDSASRIGNHTAGGVSNRARNNRVFQEDLVAGLGNRIDQKLFRGS